MAPEPVRAMSHPAVAQTLEAVGAQLQMVRDKRQLFMSHIVLKHNPPHGATRQRMQPAELGALLQVTLLHIEKV